MNIRKRFFSTLTVAACALIFALTLPCGTQAVGIGRVELQSKAGEALLARVNLATERGEHIADSCLSLALPDPLREDVSSFLISASLTLKTEGGRQYVLVSSPRLFNGVPVKFQLLVKCPGDNGVSKILTLHPASSAAGFSGEPIGVTHKVSAEEIASLRAQQKSLEAGMLAMQAQFKQLQDELSSIKAQFAQSSVGSSSAVASTTPLSSATTDMQKSHPAPPIPKQPVVQPEHPYLQETLLAAGLVLALLVLRLGLRHYSRRKLRIKHHPPQTAGPAPKPADKAAAGNMSMSSIVKHPSQGPHIPIKSGHAPAAFTQPGANPGDATSSVPFAQISGEQMAEDNSMLEEAKLYATYGRTAKAAEILQEIVSRHPSKADAWPLLLSIYSSLGKAAEFEKTARDFLRHHKNSPSWSGIQALGRTFDQNNPLYADNNSHISAAPLFPEAAASHHPLGDILIEMGALSKADLQSCLDDFDPKKHGRFGGYLVARKTITLAQLDQALLQQQGVHLEEKSGTLPSLQGIENFLVDFDPQRDGSVSEFLASRNAVTPEQLNRLFQPPPKQEVAGGTPHSVDRPHLDLEPPHE